MVLNLYICTATLQNWQPPIKGPCANYRLENVKNGILEDSETKANNGTSKQVGQTTTHPFHPPPDSLHPRVFIIFCTTSQAFSFLLRPPLKMWQWDIKTAFCNLHQHFYHPTTHRHSHHRQPSRSTATTTWFSYLHTYVSVSHKYRYTDTPTPPPTAHCLGSLLRLFAHLITHAYASFHFAVLPHQSNHPTTHRPTGGQGSIAISEPPRWDRPTTEIDTGAHSGKIVQNGGHHCNPNQ